MTDNKAKGSRESAVKSKKAEQKPTEEGFDATMDRIEALVERLDNGDLSLEESLEAFEEGMKLIKKAEGVLEKAERKVEILVSGAREGKEGEPPTQPFDLGKDPEAI